jgi:hypothetical protein
LRLFARAISAVETKEKSGTDSHLPPDIVTFMPIG